MSLRKIRKFFIIASLITTNLLGNSSLLTTAFAQTPPPTANVISVSPATQNKNVGDTGSVTINITNGQAAQGIGSYQLDLNFNPTVIRVDSVTQGAYLGSTGRGVSVTGPTINNTTGLASFGAFTLGSSPNGPTGDGILATVNFTVLASGTSVLTISNLLLTDVPGVTLVASSQDGEVTTAVVTPTPTPTTTPTPTPTPSASPSPSPSPVAGTATLTLNLANANVFANTDFNVDLNLAVNTPIIGVDAIVLFDPTKLTAMQVVDKHLLPITPPIQINNGDGTIKLSQLTNVGTPYSGVGGTVATLVFRSAVTGQRRLGFDFVTGLKTESNVFDTTGKDILLQPQNLVFEVIDHATLQLTLTTPSESTITGHQVSGILNDTESTWLANMTTDVAGVSNIVPVDDGFIGALKSFFFKVSGFLREKFSTNIASGLNSVNIGALRAGDINDDGVINNSDLSLMYDQWFGNGTADLNKDGVVNTADYFVITQNFLAVDE